jgi:hypothetical protein
LICFDLGNYLSFFSELLVEFFWAYGSTDATNPATRGPVTWPRRGR